MLGLVPQSLALYPTLSAAQNVWHFARMQGLERDKAKEYCKRALKRWVSATAPTILCMRSPAV